MAGRHGSLSGVCGIDQDRFPLVRPKRRLWVGYVTGAFGLAISAQINFLAPLRARELGAGFGVIGLIVGAGAVAAAVSSVTSGAIIDRLGTRRTFLLGTVATAILSAGFMLPTNYWWFLALQPLHGIARNTAWLASQSHVTGVAHDSDRARAAGRFGFFGNVGQMVGPPLAGLAASIVGFRSAFVVPAVYSLIFWFLGFRLQRSNAASTPDARLRQGAGFRSATKLVAIRGIQIALLLSFARLWISHVYNTFFPLFLVENGIDPSVVGMVIASSGFVAAALAPTTGYWTRRVSERTAVTVGLGFGAAGLAIAPLVGSLPLAILTPALVGVGAGLSLPLLISIVSASAPTGMRGVALGLRGMVNQSAATAAPVVVGPIMTALGLGLGFVGGGVLAGGVLLASVAVQRAGR